MKKEEQRSRDVKTGEGQQERQSGGGTLRPIVQTGIDIEKEDYGRATSCRVRG